MRKAPKKPSPAIIAARANRLRTLREAFKLSRDDFCHRCDIHPSTLQAWEDPEGERGNLSQKNVQKVIVAFKGLGVLVTCDWLLDGLGEKPIVGKSIPGYTPPSPLNEADSKALTRELLITLHEHCKEVIDMVVLDDSFAPILHKGDCVAGLYYVGDYMAKALGHLCIVQTQQGETKLGYLAKDEYGLYQLQTSPSTPSQAIEPQSASPVIFMMAKKL